MLLSAYVSLSSKCRHNGKKLKFQNVKKWSTHRKGYISFFGQDSGYLVPLTFNYILIN